MPTFTPQPSPVNKPTYVCVLFPVFFLAVLASHYTLLHLPYFWDEGGYYVPAALDFFRTGTLIPQSTVTNAHPPLPMIVMAGWWKIFGFHILATRVLVCLFAAAALLAVFRLTRTLLGERAAWATTLLTAIYPVWFAQSTLAHADIFAAAFTLWAIALYLEPNEDRPHLKIAILFSLAALSKEDAIITPLALAAYELWLSLRAGRNRALPKTPATTHLKSVVALSTPVLPLLAWYGYHRFKTGFIFGNPEFLRYNATANLSAYRIFLCLYHRIVHLTLHMNMFVAVACAIAAILMPAIATRARLSRTIVAAICVILIANVLEFSILAARSSPLPPPDVPTGHLDLRSHLAASHAAPAVALARRAHRRRFPRGHLDQPSLRLRTRGQPHLPRHDRRPSAGHRLPPGPLSRSDRPHRMARSRRDLPPRPRLHHPPVQVRRYRKLLPRPDPARRL